MKILYIGLENKPCYLDDIDYLIFNKLKWSLSNGKYTSYARTRISGKNVFMHRLILGLTNPKILVDHKDRNGLNNQRENIRICTPSENQKNKKPSGVSKYIGVSRHVSKRKYKNKSGVIIEYKAHPAWFSSIKYNGKYICLGRFKNEEDAAKAYNEAALKYHGEFARINQLS